MSRSNGCGSASPRRQRSFWKPHSAWRHWRMAFAVRGEGERRLGEPSAAFGASIRVDLGVLQLLDAAGAGELVDVGSDPQQHCSDATAVDDEVVALGVVCFGVPTTSLRNPTVSVSRRSCSMPEWSTALHADPPAARRNAGIFFSPAGGRAVRRGNAQR